MSQDELGNNQQGTPGEVDYTIGFNNRFYRKGAQTTPIPLRCGRMPVKKPELNEGETLLEDIAEKYGIKVTCVRNLAKKYKPEVIRRVTCYRVYRRDEIERIVVDFLKRNRKLMDSEANFEC